MITTRDIRALKGAALSILILGLLDPQPHAAAWYARMSGYTDKPVTQALALLCEYDLMQKTPRGWRIATDRQLILTAPQPNRNNSESIPSSSSSLNKNQPQSPIEKKKNKQTKSELFRLNLQACRLAGIRSPKAEQLAALPHVNPQFIAAHVAAANAERLPRPLGTAIHRIQNNWSQPQASLIDERNKYTSGAYADYLD